MSVVSVGIEVAVLWRLRKRHGETKAGRLFRALPGRLFLTSFPFGRSLLAFRFHLQRLRLRCVSHYRRPRKDRSRRWKLLGMKTLSRPKPKTYIRDSTATAGSAATKQCSSSRTTVTELSLSANVLTQCLTRRL